MKILTQETNCFLIQLEDGDKPIVIRAPSPHRRVRIRGRGLEATDAMTSSLVCIELVGDK